MVVKLKETEYITEGAVKSSNILRLLYNSKTKVLYIFFLNKKVYSYVPVPEPLFKEMCKAPSIGKFFIQHIKKNPEFGFKQEFSITDGEREMFLEESKEEQ